jgi:hypothetical protein
MVDNIVEKILISKIASLRFLNKSLRSHPFIGFFQNHKVRGQGTISIQC